MSHHKDHPDIHQHETPVLHDPKDKWHDHSADEKPQQAHAEVGNARAIMGVGVALFFVIAFAVVAVYAYYMWFLTQRLNEQERAFGTDKDSPAAVAVQYKRDALRRLQTGGDVSIKSTETLPAANYSLIKIEDAIKATAQNYAAAAAPTPAKPAAR